MKIDNKKMAQKRRAKERKKQKIISIVVKFCKIGLPTILLLAIIIFAITKPLEKSSDTDAGDSTTLSTKSSLEIKNGDTVNIDYVGSIDGVEFEGGNTQGIGTDLTIGSGSYIDDFEEQLIGAHPGDEVDVNVTFPEDYGNSELDGKDALFKVVVNGIYVSE